MNYLRTFLTLSLGIVGCGSVADPAGAGDSGSSGDGLCIDAEAGVQLGLSLDASDAPDPESPEPELYVLEGVSCVADIVPTDLVCETDSGVMQTIALTIEGTGQPLPWSSGAELVLSVAWDVSVSFGIEHRAIVVRSAADELLLVASDKAELPMEALIEPLSIAVDDSQCAPADEEDAEYQAPTTYSLDGVSALLVGNDQAVLETPSGAFDLRQAESRIFDDNHQSLHLTFSMVRVAG